MSFTEADTRFMRMALEEARAAYADGEVPVGAIIVCNGRVIGRGHNLTESLTDVTAHAEMQAITAAAQMLGGKYLNECELYVTVEPCIMCAGALGWSQIGRVVYGASDPKRGSSLFAPSPFHPRTKIENGLLEDECAELMKSFFSRKR